jgi:UDP-N-acetylmuramoyl-L-alanyl-D-glutamate--2,6-diaminopimelate ligase
MVEDTPAKVLDFSFKGKALINVKVLKSSSRKTELDVEGIKIETPLIGKFNAYNVTQALMICTALGYDGKTAASHIKNCFGAEGRLEKVNHPDAGDDKPLVLVDYAHTPDALKNVTSSLAGLKQPGQTLVVVFGCGGDRDKTKRPEMARIAQTYADRVIVTSDNPRTEDPDKIIDDITKGFSKGFEYARITSRRAAIHKAIAEGDGQTIVLIAGKGHETYQEVHGKRSHFDDREEARKALSETNGHVKNSEVN